MKQDSKIAYCDFHGGALNFATGCTKVSEGCRYCWAEAIYKRFKLRRFSVVKTHRDKLEKLRDERFPSNGNVRGLDSKPICFVCDTGDLFHKKVPLRFLDRALHIMATRTDVTWLILTKRAARMRGVLRAVCWRHRKAPHVWFGISAENQKALDERWPWLDDSQAQMRWLSVEPMLGPIELGDVWPDWIVCGGESGPNRRPFDPAWAIALKSQCYERGVPFFFKQGSGLYPGMNPTLLDREWKAWPR